MDLMEHPNLLDMEVSIDARYMDPLSSTDSSDDFSDNLTGDSCGIFISSTEIKERIEKEKRKLQEYVHDLDKRLFGGIDEDVEFTNAAVTSMEAVIADSVEQEYLLESLTKFLEMRMHLDVKNVHLGDDLKCFLKGNQLFHSTRIRNVWAGNLREEFLNISSIIRQGVYVFVSMDTEFPGVVTRPPVKRVTSQREFAYEMIRLNCNRLNLIQLGLTLFDKNGTTPPGICTWQFNFKFNLMEDEHSKDSIKLLAGSGIEFDRHFCEGIEKSKFSELLLCSGLVLDNCVTWVVFHGAFDLGYVYQMLCGGTLPSGVEEYVKSLHTFFPVVYDIEVTFKKIKKISAVKSSRGGLQKLANFLGIKRIGVQHQAGSDSLLTGLAYFKLKELYPAAPFDNLYEVPLKRI